MAARLLLVCLVLASIFFYTWSFVNDQRWAAYDNRRARLLAKDTLQAAHSSVHEAMRSLFEVYEDEPRTTSERNAIDRLGTKFERLPLEELSSLQLVNGDHLAGMQVDMCGSFAGKRITMIGGEHIYRLHVLLLQRRQRVEGKPFPCRYHEFCTHHHICLPYQQFRDDTPQPRYVKPPTAQELIDTESAAVNYIVSDTLCSTRNESSWEYTSPFVDAMTGVRLRETYWLAAARKANIVILGRGPLSAPGQTYTGNWSFLHHVPDYVDKSRAAVAGGYGNHDDVHLYQLAPRSLEILNAAVHLTVSRFLPDLFQLLRSIRRDLRPSRRKWLIWPSSWYRIPHRGVARTVLLRSRVRPKVLDMVQYTFLQRRRPQSPTAHALMLHLSVFLTADVMNTTVLEDPWTLLFNAQVYLQNMVLRELLPRYGIVFLPLDVLWVEDDQARDRGQTHGTTINVDLEYVTETFLASTDYVLRYLE